MQSRGAGQPDDDVLGDAAAFAGVSKYPARIKWALLGWMAWKDATARALAERGAGEKHGAAAEDRAAEEHGVLEEQR